MDFPAFLRTFEVRAPNIMWLLGAGCSVSAGIPSANNIIWDCKSRIYCSEQNIPRSKVSDINNPIIQNTIQDYLSAKGIFPDEDGDEDEYSYYFQRAITSASDRQTYIKELMSKSSPSYGHLILSSLSIIGKCPIVWTTNFDKLFESATYQISGTANDLVVADLGEPEKAIRSLNNKTFPLLVKLHGDFHSERLKNSSEELRAQDENMREALSQACINYGLCIMGYSGRDKSVMDALLEKARTKGSFPHGIFWFTRPGTKVLPSVDKLITEAKNNNIQAEIIEVNNFDEALDNIKRYLGNFPQEIESILKPKSAIKTDAPIPGEARNFPLLRLNALCIESFPTMCKLIECDIGGFKEILSALEKTAAKVIARRIKKGVIAFGSDAEIKKAFSSYNIKRMEIHPIDLGRLDYNTEEYKLIHDALCQAIKTKTGLVIEEKKEGKYLISNPSITSLDLFNELEDCSVTALNGTVPNTTIQWREACKIDLDFKFNKFWIILSPRTLISITNKNSEVEINAAKSFVREKTAPREHPRTKQYIGYNRIAASILAGWMKIITGKSNESSISIMAFETGDSLNPQFEIQTGKVISGRIK